MKVGRPAAGIAAIQTDEVVIASPNISFWMAGSCAALGTPVVLFNRVSKGAEVSSACYKNRVGVRLATKVLGKARHNQSAFLADTADTSTNTERLTGFSKRYGEFGLPALTTLKPASHCIRVTTICPTIIETPMTRPLFADPEFRAAGLAKIKLSHFGQCEDLIGGVVWYRTRQRR